MTVTIFLEVGALATITQHAQMAFPNECCGILLGKRTEADTWHVTSVLKSANVTQDDPARTFEIDPTLLIRTQKACRDGGQNILGYYHSHPNGAPHPSERDKKNAWDADKVWIIASLDDRKTAPETRAFVTKKDGAAIIFASAALTH